jgi:chromosome partitioning protein
VTHVIAVANQKGGVGKTTTSVNLSAALAGLGKRVLLVDLDPQGNATMGSGIDKHELSLSIYDWLMSDATLLETRLSTVGGYDLLPSNIDLTAAEVALLQFDEREFVIAKGLRAQALVYEYVVIDCPPSLNILTVNALASATGVLVPMQCEYYALEGLSALLDTVEGIRSNANPRLKIDGLLRTMYDARNGLSRDVSRQLIKYFADKVYRTVVPRNVRLAEAPSHGLPVMMYDAGSRGSLAYQALASEMLKRHGTTT